jgi:hypothetical protein
MATTPPLPPKYRDDFSTQPDPPEDDDCGSHSSDHDSPNEYEMGDIRAVSPPPSSIWGRAYSDKHPESSHDVSSDPPHALTFDLEDQMHHEHEVHDAPLTRTSPLFKCLIGVAMLFMIVVGSIFVKNKLRIEETSPTLNEQFNSENTVIEGIIPSSDIANSNGSSGKEGSSNNSSTSQNVGSGNDQQQSSVQSSGATVGYIDDLLIEEATSSKGDVSVSQEQTQNASTTAATTSGTAANGSVQHQGSANTGTDNNENEQQQSSGPSSTTTTVATTTTPYVPKNEAGEVDIGQWCGHCAGGPPGVSCDGRVSFFGTKYGTPELEAKMSLMEQGRCHMSTAAEVAAKRPVYPCRKSQEDQGGEEGAENFCGYCKWKNTQFDCWSRLEYVLNTYQNTESKAKQDLIEVNECVLPANYIEQFNIDKENGVEDWCAYCSWGPHKCDTKLSYYTQSGEKTKLAEKKEILDAGQCKKQPLCDAIST